MSPLIYFIECGIHVLIFLSFHLLGFALQDGDHNSFMAAYHKLDNQYAKDLSSGLVKASDPYVHPMRPGEIKYFKERKEGAEGASMYEKFFQGHLPSINCFNHISKNRCSNYGRNSIQRFVEIFKLKTYMMDRKDPDTFYYPYCAHPLVQPLLYGWFPVKYIPYCPKLESLG
jgi:hypothetical protein